MLSPKSTTGDAIVGYKISKKLETLQTWMAHKCWWLQIEYSLHWYTSHST